MYSGPLDWTSVGAFVTLGIDHASDRAAFRQIADRLRGEIESGELLPGAKLPSERTLMDAYGTARGTIREAIALLRSEGLVTVEHGRGAFVRRRPPVRRLASDRFARHHRDRGKAAYLVELEADGRRPDVQVLYVGPGPAPSDMASRLGVDEGAQVLVRRRMYLADGEPMETATSYVPWEIAEGTAMTETQTGPGGIYARIEERGHRLERFSEEVTARMPTDEERRTLRLVPGTPVIALVRTAFDESGMAVEVCDTVLAADRYVLSYELPAR
ncbi:GntR family transcriptional regulator [Pseudofrankia sp. BMG5.36]|nr:GntR family transcriptional regulator [Pseudofrankia sp. BMG5.36]